MVCPRSPAAKWQGWDSYRSLGDREILFTSNIDLPIFLSQALAKRWEVREGVGIHQKFSFLFQSQQKTLSSPNTPCCPTGEVGAERSFSLLTWAFIPSSRLPFLPPVSATSLWLLLKLSGALQTWQLRSPRDGDMPLPFTIPGCVLGMITV